MAKWNFSLKGICCCVYFYQSFSKIVVVFPENVLCAVDISFLILHHWVLS